MTHGDEHYVYYFGRPGRHDQYTLKGDTGNTAIGLARWRLDGFAYLTSDTEPGVVTTKFFRVDESADTLELNLELREGGSLVVEVLGRDGGVLSSYGRGDFEPVRGNGGVHEAVGWRGQDGVVSLRGIVVALRFHLERGSLFAFQMLSRQ